MMPSIHRQVLLQARPDGIPQSTHFEVVATRIPDLADRQFLVRNEYLSVEPAMRGAVGSAVGDGAFIPT